MVDKDNRHKNKRNNIPLTKNNNVTKKAKIAWLFYVMKCVRKIFPPKIEIIYHSSLSFCAFVIKPDTTNDCDDYCLYK
jgi:hypothetical protein